MPNEYATEAGREAAARRGPVTAPAGGRFTDPQEAAEAIRAGNATVTLVSVRTGTRYTYRVRRPKDESHQPCPWFVSLLTGPNNRQDYSYIGMLCTDNTFRTTRASTLPNNAAPVAGFRWAVAKLAAGELPDTLEVWHEGKCCKCGRKLTTPTSIARGLGPECASRAA